MKKEGLQNIKDEIFNSFNPQDEVWIVGGLTGRATYISTGEDGRTLDSSPDADMDFDEV